MDGWFYTQGREKCGPFTLEQLARFIQTGVVTASTLVWNRGMKEWSPAIQVPQLLGIPSTPRSSSEPQRVDAAAAAPPITGGNPWDGELARPRPVPIEECAQETAATTPAQQNPPSVALNFNAKRPKPEHQRLGSKVKHLFVRTAAAVIALGILGGGGYLGAQYLGVFEPDLGPKLRYLPDNSDFFFTINIPKAMSIARSFDPTGTTIPTDLHSGHLPISPDSIQDLTVAGNIGEKRWVVIATLNNDLDIMKFFPGVDEPDSTRAGGTKIYYHRDMADLGIDFAIAQPSKTTLLVGPLDTLKQILKRRTAPELPAAFQPLLETGNNDTWASGAVDIGSLWQMADQFPIELDDKQRWLLQSLDKATFTLGASGSGDYAFELVAHCNQAKDAAPIAKELRQAIADQRAALLEQLVQMGQGIDAETLKRFSNIGVETGAGGTVTISQRISSEMLDEISRLFSPDSALLGQR